MIGDLLPATVASADTRGDDVDTSTVYPEEEAAVRMAVAKRRQEHRTVRVCARRALAQLGHPPAPLLSGRRGEPLWPPGVVGSMTHCDGYRAAAVASADDIRAIGIDAEHHAPLPAGVLDAVAVPAERSRLAEAERRSRGVHWDRLLFSAKESVFKAVFPVTGVALGFGDADVTFSTAPAGAGPRGSFAVRLLVPVRAVPSRFDGTWLVVDGLVLTAVVLPSP
jgi:4'-phosphopantetheinyl transferase EntD